MTKVMMTYRLTTLRFLPATLPLRPLYSVIRNLYSVLCTPQLSCNPPQLFRTPVSPGEGVSVLDSYYFQPYTWEQPRPHDHPSYLPV